MMKGYLTIFLSLSLSLLAGFILLFTGMAIQNAQKIRLECVLDTSMNAVLSEYHIGLLERYGLLYIDASYLGQEPRLSNVEARLSYYLLENADSPWGNLNINQVNIVAFDTAAAENGASLRHQVITYIQDTGIKMEEANVLGYLGEVQILDGQDVQSEFSNIMGQLAGMELPTIMNDLGLIEEVPLSNPADWVYGLVGSDVMYLADINLGTVSNAGIPLGDYYSHRQISNIAGRSRNYKQNSEQFLNYLFYQMSWLGKPRDDTLLSCELEYLLKGQASDIDNVRAVAQMLFRWRLADNVNLALSDGELRTAAQIAAQELQAVQLKEEFESPVTESILYACAYLETIGDMKVIYSGGKIPLRKAAHSMSVEYVKNGTVYRSNNSNGLPYAKYLACGLLLLDDKTLNARTMDVMEMDIRAFSENKLFAMDWCIESYEAVVTASAEKQGNYQLRRRYGYF